MPLWFTIMIAIILSGATGATFWYLWRAPTMLRNDYIAQDVARLVDIFHRINTTCSIISFDHVHNYIEFLNVVLFKGSEVGPMNVRYPDEWEGPYLRDNPAIQGTAYMVLVTYDGHYVMPGEGVQLGDGSTLGTDIILNKDTDIPSLIQEGGALNHQGTPLAAPITIDGP